MVRHRIATLSLDRHLRSLAFRCHEGPRLTIRRLRGALPDSTLSFQPTDPES